MVMENEFWLLTLDQDLPSCKRKHIMMSTPHHVKIIEYLPNI